MSNIHDRLKKIKALAEQGVGGEAEEAKRLLAELMEKYNITEDDIDDQKVETRQFWYHDEFERKILLQVMFKVMDDMDKMVFYNYFGQRKRRNTMGLDCTESQYIEINFLFDFYIQLFKKEQKLLLDAFISKHNLFGTKASKGHEPKELSPEESYRKYMMECGLSDADIVRRIENE